MTSRPTDFKYTDGVPTAHLIPVDHIPELIQFSKELSSHIHPSCPVYLMMGGLVDYDGVAVSVTGANKPPASGDGVLDVDFQVNHRSRNFHEVFQLAGFVSKYPLVRGGISVQFSPPDPNIGSSECAITASMMCGEIYPWFLLHPPTDVEIPGPPFRLIGDPDETRSVYIEFRAGEQVLVPSHQVTP